MGIWGNLKEIALPELLLLIEERKGVLTLREGGRPGLRLDVAQGRIGRAREGRRRLSLPELEERLLALTLGGKASFGFYPSERVGPVVGPRIRPLALKLSTLADEIRPVLHQLPNPEARFRLISARLLGNVRWDPLFLKALDLLAQGVSARALAQVLGIPLTEARYFLLTLSRSRRVRPEPTAPRPAATPIGRLVARFMPQG